VRSGYSSTTEGKNFGRQKRKCDEFALIRQSQRQLAPTLGGSKKKRKKNGISGKGEKKGTHVRMKYCWPRSGGWDQFPKEGERKAMFSFEKKGKKREGTPIRPQKKKEAQSTPKYGTEEMISLFGEPQNKKADCRGEEGNKGEAYSRRKAERQGGIVRSPLGNCLGRRQAWGKKTKSSDGGRGGKRAGAFQEHLGKQSVFAEKKKASDQSSFRKEEHDEGTYKAI